MEEAEDGAAGLDKAKKGRFDLVLCDIKMPKMDGIEVLEKLQAHNEDLPVVMISGHGTIDTAVDALKKGAFDFIQKPPDINRILVSVRNALDRGDLVKETKVLRTKVGKAQGQRRADDRREQGPARDPRHDREGGARATPGC